MGRSEGSAIWEANSEAIDNGGEVFAWGCWRDEVAGTAGIGNGIGGCRGGN
jgi:hypothetical protein